MNEWLIVKKENNTVTVKGDSVDKEFHAIIELIPVYAAAEFCQKYLLSEIIFDVPDDEREWIIPIFEKHGITKIRYTVDEFIRKINETLTSDEIKELKEML